MLTYKQALQSRVFENKSYQNLDGTFSLVYSCFNCSVWGDTDCVDTEVGSSITELVTIDEASRPAVWKAVSQEYNDTYIQLQDGKRYKYFNLSFIDCSNDQFLDYKDVPPQVLELARVYGNFGY